ncbi:MAG: glycine oxidase ThiO [Acidimicrobiia bacterium]|nr:glycine oxidase ThiO [Acidimicrobiia bacterium]
MRVAVLGAGVIGLSVAWRCARRGMEVTVHDPAPARAAANVAAGMLAPVTELHAGEEALLALNLESARRWPSFAAELAGDAGCDPGYVTCGTVAVARDLDDLRVLDDLHAQQVGLGLQVERLSGREVRRREPALAPSARGGLFVGGDHQVDNRRLLSALRRAAGARAVGMVTTSPEDPPAMRALDADAVVVAAGWRSPALVPGLAVRPVKGQVLRLRSDGRSVLPAHVVRGLDVYVVPRGDEVVVGATVEDVGEDLTVRAGAVHDLLHDAADLVPGVAEAELVECGVGLRPATPDNAPLIGALDERTVVATGHYRNGILLAPVTADAVAELLVSGEAPDVVAPFRPERPAVRR